MLKDLNLFITGGCGFIGSNFCNYIVNKVNKLVIIDKLDYICNEKNINEIIKLKNVIFIKDDLLKHNILETLEKYEINYIIHFAAQTHVDNSYNNFLNFINDNIITTYNLFNSVYLYDLKYNKKINILHFSTDEIYGSTSEEGYLFKEETNFNPTNPYASTKASCEMIVNTYKYTYKLPIIITRCNNVYGKYQYFEKVIPLFINKAINNESLTIHGNGEYIRDFIHVDDVISAILIIMEKGIIGEIYNIGNDNPIKIIDLANIIIKNIKSGRIEYIKDRAYNDFRYPLDMTKLKKLGWTNKINFNDGLNEVIEWMKENKNYFNEIKGKIFNDKRGKLQFLPVPSNEIKQQLISTNKKNVLRGIHVSPYGKHIICINGSFIDYVINFETMTYDKFYITSENLNKIYIPPNHGHCFISLEDDSKILYQIEGIYDEKNEKNYNYLCPFINLDIPIINDYIISDMDKNALFYKKVDYILLGSIEFLGKYMEKILKEQDKSYICINTRIENIELLKKQLEFYKPKYIINATGIKWSDENKIETYQLILAKICDELNIHITYFISGIIYNDNEKLIKEIDEPDNNDTKYRILLEKCLECYKNILLLRINYPIIGNNDDKCFINKIKKYKKSIHDININITVVPNLFPKIPEIIEKNNIGIINFVNKNSIKTTELLKLLKIEDYNIDNNNSKQLGILDTTKLENLIKLDDIKEVIKKYNY